MVVVWVFEIVVVYEVMVFGFVWDVVFGGVGFGDEGVDFFVVVVV